MISSITAVSLNLLLDYLFIIQFDLGLKGAALASVIGQGVSFIISFIFYFIMLSYHQFQKLRLMQTHTISPFIYIGPLNNEKKKNNIDKYRTMNY